MYLFERTFIFVNSIGILLFVSSCPFFGVVIEKCDCLMHQSQKQQLSECANMVDYDKRNGITQPQIRQMRPLWKMCGSLVCTLPFSFEKQKQNRNGEQTKI